MPSAHATPSYYTGYPIPKYRHHRELTMTSETIALEGLLRAATQVVEFTGDHCASPAEWQEQSADALHVFELAEVVLCLASEVDRLGAEVTSLREQLSAGHHGADGDDESGSDDV